VRPLLLGRHALSRAVRFVRVPARLPPFGWIKPAARCLVSANMR
jgi:hypothetical protein